MHSCYEGNLLYWGKLPQMGVEINLKSRLFWIALVFISVSWVANVLYAHSKQLQEPIFLEHEIDTKIHDGSHLTFYYLTNANDSSFITSITINGIHGYPLENEWAEPIQTFPHYVLRQVHIQINPYDIENNLQEGPMTTQTLDVFFNDGKVLTTPIGNIAIRPDAPIDDTLIPLGASGGNDWSMNWYSAEETVTIESISMIPEALQQHITVKIDATTLANDHDLSQKRFLGQNMSGVAIEDLELPLEITEGENLYILWDVAPEFLGSIQSSLVLSGTTAAGKSFTLDSPLYSQMPYLEYKDVQKIINMWEEVH